MAMMAVVDTKVPVCLACSLAFLHRELHIRCDNSIYGMGVGVGEATLVMVGVLVGTDLIKQILLAFCEICDLGRQTVFVGLAYSIIGNLAAASIGCGGERIERLVKLDAVGTSARAVVFVRCVITDD
jgi:hypothetical protein